MRFSVWALLLVFAAAGRADQMAYWSFGPDSANYTTAVTEEDINGTPTLQLLNQDIDANGKNGIAYTNAAGNAYAAGRAAAWDDIKGGGDDAEWIVTLDTTGWEDLALRFDYQGNPASPIDNIDLEYSLDGGSTFIDITNNMVIAATDAVWRTFAYDLSAVDAIEQEPSVQLRFKDLDKNDGNDEFRFDNFELTGSPVAAPLPPSLSVEGGLVQELREGSAMSFTVTAAEPNGDAVTLTASNLPPGAVVTPNPATAPQSATNTFTWTPEAPTNASVLFHASDADGSTSVVVSIEVRPEVSLILNEFSAVSGSKYLGGGVETSPTNADTFFGRIEGNGENWIELVVVEDHLDLRGWQFQWAEVGELEGAAGGNKWFSNGSDPWYGSSTTKQGIITIATNAAALSDLREGTILTFVESESHLFGTILTPTDTSFDPDGDDWWINLSTLDEAGEATPLATTTNNILGDPAGAFSVGNSDWELTIRDAAGGRVFGPIGEAFGGWGGGGVGSEEFGRLEDDPAADEDFGDYDDGTNFSTFGSANIWNENQDRQSFSQLRAWSVFADDADGLVINEYNAVGTHQYLGDSTYGGATDKVDTAFGRIAGNGGDWIELVVTEDFLDIRGRQLRWAETGNTNTTGADVWFGDGTVAQGTLTFATNAALWSNLRIGTVITISEDILLTNEAGAVIADGSDPAADPQAGDWRIHISTRDEAGAATARVEAAHNLSGAPAGAFDVGPDDWQVSIVDATGTNTLLGPVSEIYFNGGVSDQEVGRLEEDPDAGLNADEWDDADDSTFGGPNEWGGTLQDWNALRAWTSFVNRTPPFVINEFNAVGPSKFLDGDAFGDSTDSDATLGRIQGNGGDWIELVVVDDHADLRGWSLRWAEPGENTTTGADVWFGDPAVEQGILTFATNALWADLRGGTLITIGEDIGVTNESGAVVVDGTDATAMPTNGDWWIHISTRAEAGEAAPRVLSVHNLAGAQPGDFSVGNNQWEIRAIDPGGTNRFGPVGEGYVWGGGNLKADEIGRLEADPQEAVSISDYDDDTDSSFAAPNVWGGVTQSFEAVRAWTHDVDSDGLPDEWERAQFNGSTTNGAAGDWDGDGSDNRTEYIAGTQPTNAQSLFRAETGRDASAGPAVRFYAVSGRVYEIYVADSLTGPADWSPMESGVIGSNDWREIADPAVRTQSFYRIDVSLP